LKFPITIYPVSWSRKRRTAATIAAAMSGMFLFLWMLTPILRELPSPIGPAAVEFGQAARVTMLLTVLAGPLGVLLGIVVALGKLSKFTPLRLMAEFYTWVLRGTPLLVQILFVYFALPFGWKLSEFNAALLALTLNVAAYNAEAIRSGILAVHKGQTEAARSLGLSKFQTFVDVVFPQAMRIALPPLVNNIVSLLKDTSLAYSIGVVEMVNIANRVNSSSFEPVPVFTTLAAVYLTMTTITTQISNALDRQMDVERH
jgi:polar amino acid transport system permease protein